MLSEEYFQKLATDYFAEQWAVDKAVTLMREIEAEVRKQDDELILQMLEALDDGSEHTAQCITNYYIRPCDCKKVTTITAARARLGEKT